MLLDSTRFAVNGQYIQTPTAQTFNATYPAYLFGINRGGVFTEPCAKLKIYGCKIWNGTTLVRNFVPCVNASGTAGMYDVINNQFYTNAGTGDFLVG